MSGRKKPKPLHNPPSIEKKLEEAKVLLRPWEDTRKRLRNAYEARDFVIAEDITDIILEILQRVWLIFRYDSSEKEGTGGDWRSDPQLKRAVLTIHKQQRRAKDAYEMQNWQQFNRTLDRSEGTMKSIFSRCAHLLKSGSDLSVLRRERSKALEGRARTNREKHAMFKKYMEEYQSPESEMEEFTRLPDDPMELSRILQRTRETEKETISKRRTKKEGEDDGGDSSQMGQ